MVQNQIVYSNALIFLFLLLEKVSSVSVYLYQFSCISFWSTDYCDNSSHGCCCG